MFRAADVVLLGRRPRWSLLKHTNYAQTRSSPRLRRAADGRVAVAGGTLDASPLAGRLRSERPKIIRSAG